MSIFTCSDNGVGEAGLQTARVMVLQLLLLLLLVVVVVGDSAISEIFV